jgi:CheY-like chemotaxis protein
MTEPRARIIDVLLVEDDPGDVLITREAFEDHLHNRLDVVADGAEALAYLRHEQPYADVPTPDLGQLPSDGSARSQISAE